MSEGTPNDPGQPRMPWEPETSPGRPAEPTKPPDGGWTPPEPTDPTTVWTPPSPGEPSPASPAAEPMPPTNGGGLVDSAPVRWVPPPAARGAVEVAPGLAFADTTSRAVAYIIDGVILGIVGGIIGAILNPAAVNPATTTPADLKSLMATTPDLVGSVLIVVIDLAYFTVAWTGGRRATIGQRLFNIQVGNAFDGRALSTGQAIRRTLGLGGWISLISIVPGLFLLSGLIGLTWSAALFITTATSPTKQGLHDRFAHTALVRPSDKETSGCATACLAVVIAITLLSFVSILALYVLSDQVITILSQIGESI